MNAMYSERGPSVLYGPQSIELWGGRGRRGEREEEWGRWNTIKRCYCCCCLACLDKFFGESLGVSSMNLLHRFLKGMDVSVAAAENALMLYAKFTQFDDIIPRWIFC